MILIHLYSFLLSRFPLLPQLVPRKGVETCCRPPPLFDLSSHFCKKKKKTLLLPLEGARTKERKKRGEKRGGREEERNTLSLFLFLFSFLSRSSSAMRALSSSSASTSGRVTSSPSWQQQQPHRAPTGLRGAPFPPPPLSPHRRRHRNLAPAAKTTALPAWPTSSSDSSPSERARWRVRPIR